jgi:hypothetical protein
MLPEPLRLLISEFASGDLSPRRQEAAVRLLRHSREARQLLGELKLIRRRLRALAPPPLPSGFTERVMNALPERPLIIEPTKVRVPRASRLRFAAHFIGTAAVILTGLFGTNYWLSSQTNSAALDQAVARRDQRTGDSQPPQSRPVVEPDASDARVSTDGGGSENAVAIKPPDSPHPKMPTGPDPLGNLPAIPPEFVAVSSPRLLVVPAGGFDDANTGKQFQEELGKAESERVDLFCRDTSRALERIQAAFKGRGVRLTVDALAQESAKRRLRAHYVIYCDELTAVEWGQLMHSLATFDKKSGENIFDQVVVMPADPTDQKELSVIFGSESTQARGRGDGRRTDGKKDGKAGFVAVTAPGRMLTISKEFRQFLDGRHDRTSGAPAVLLTLRFGGGT